MIKKSDDVIAAFNILDNAKLAPGSRSMRLLLKLSKLSGRTVVGRRIEPSPKPKYALLNPGVKVLGPIVPLYYDIVFWQESVGESPSLFVGTLKFTCLLSAIKELMPVKFLGTDADLMVIHAFKLAPDDVLEKLYRWCLNHEGGKATTAEVLVAVVKEVNRFSPPTASD